MMTYDLLKYYWCESCDWIFFERKIHVIKSVINQMRDDIFIKGKNTRFISYLNFM